jgi:hypothetical protein
MSSMNYWILRMAKKGWDGVEKPAPSPIVTAASEAEAIAMGRRRVKNSVFSRSEQLIFKRAEPHPAGR